MPDIKMPHILNLADIVFSCHFTHPFGIRIFCDLKLKAGAHGVLISCLGLDIVSLVAEIDERGLVLPTSSIC